MIITKYIEVPDLKAEKDGLVLEVTQEQNPENPREWDNFGTMIGWYKGYTLGDKQIKEQYQLDLILIDILDEKFGLSYEQRYNVMEYASTEKLLEAIHKHTKTVMLPLYLFDHSGISISTSTSKYRMMDGAGWDWGTCGIIYATEKKIKEEMRVEKIDESVIEKVKDILEGKVNDYDLYLRGESYYFRLYKKDDPKNTVDSCGGFMADSNTDLKKMLKEHLDQNYPGLVDLLEDCHY